ncbi:LysR family transcriptional regulator [Pseudovibrio sp. Tun.PSC04-5.I4]|uniref:LysR family transcriptional regulator n=1 Tax=Pseudovibrio sp. Tun.PSC04-5.I4 TaxID=1798213 RepID=UPI000888BC95|nr:LysR family transcriptional regulator [Pseudovibrio sp. Tun.PSC04-5.I4]SDQ76808.1 DNA-binding transcriptional regulator, LysR family [Pseudovibrio sp. Tun.PSC04-5.I4]
MNIKLNQLSWDLIAVFVAVAETGSLSAAAKRLHQSQPTIGRQVKAIETALGVSLFYRHQRGLGLTEDGQALLLPAKAMHSAAAQFLLQVEGRKQEGLSGTVRITASHVISNYVLPKLIAEFRVDHPAIQVDLVSSDDAQNLLFQEADIAVRMFNPTQLDIVAKKIGETPLGLYASQAFLNRVGVPKTREDLFALDWVGYDQSDMIIRGMIEAGLTVDRDFFSVRCDDRVVYWELIRAGCGVGLGQIGIGSKDKGLVRLEVEEHLPALPVWLASPHTLKQVPRIKLLFDYLAERHPKLL